jgi:hypothetical protein
MGLIGKGKKKKDDNGVTNLRVEAIKRTPDSCTIVSQDASCARATR